MHNINTQDTGSFTKSLQIVTIPDQEQIPHLSQNRSTGRSVMGLGADPALLEIKYLVISGLEKPKCSNSACRWLVSGCLNECNITHQSLSRPTVGSVWVAIPPGNHCQMG